MTSTPKTLVALLCGALYLSGCASNASEVAPSYVSPLAFADYSCGQLSQEAHRVSSAVSRATAQQDQAAADDAAATAVALILFWPAAFMIDGDNGNSAELARLRGEMTAIEQANIQRNCGLQFARG